MMRSLFAGVSGLRNHQIRMDVIGNNIANVNTVGYKASRVTFEEAYAQLVQGASRPPGRGAEVMGGTNPVQIGLGMDISSIDLLFTQGTRETTGVSTDLSIDGDSFFVVSDGQVNSYTRSGNFQLDADGHLVSATNGYVVQGRVAQNGELTDTIGDIHIPFGQRSPARSTSEVKVGGNLDVRATPPTRDTTIRIYDEQGMEYELKVTFENTGTDTWDYEVEVDPASGLTITDGDTGTLNFTAGDLDPADALADLEIDNDWDITLDFGSDGNGVSQYASAYSVILREQDGYTMGNLDTFAIDPTGTIVGSFTNGVTLTLGQIALADFNNPAGLTRSGDNMYSLSPNSGSAAIGFAGEGSQSTITSGSLEMSNVDLSQEFTDMITAQRGFQSNARVITTSDEMLQELVNLKR